MKHIFILAFLLFPLSIFGQTISGVNGDCVVGGQQTLTSGLPSTATQQIGTTNVLQGAGVEASFPSCLVTVYLTGTVTKANIFSNNNPTPTPVVNPFTANGDSSYTFFAAAACYDIVLSSGSVALPYSRTLADVCIGGSGGGGGGGSGGVGPGTILHIPVFTSPTTIGDSEGISTGTGPVQWPLGVSLGTNALFYNKCRNGSTGTTANLLVAYDASGCAINAQPTDTQNLKGIARTTGTGGTVDIAYSGQFNLTFDNQTAIGDWAILGFGSQGHDAGAVQPSGIDTIGKIDSINAGTGTLAVVEMNLPDVTNTSSGGGTGIVSPCATPGSIYYAQTVSSTATCDPGLTTDGAGGLIGKSFTSNGTGGGLLTLFGSSSGSCPFSVDATSTTFTTTCSQTIDQNALVLTNTSATPSTSELDILVGNTGRGTIAFSGSGSSTIFFDVDGGLVFNPASASVQKVTYNNAGVFYSGSSASFPSGISCAFAPHGLCSAVYQQPILINGNTSGGTVLYAQDIAGTHAIGFPAADGTVLLNTTAGVISAANYSGATWTAKGNTAFASADCPSGACTVVFPDSISGDGHLTTLAIPRNGTALFPGSATFTACNITGDTFFNVVMDGQATITFSGSNCSFKVQNNSPFATLQTQHSVTLNGLHIDCNGQSGSIGLLVDNGHARGNAYNVETHNCADSGIKISGGQFWTFYNSHDWASTVGIKIYDTSGGGGNSIVFVNPITNNNSVGVLIAESFTIGMGPNYFINPNFLSASTSEMAVFGNPATGGQLDTYWIGGSPEATSGSPSTVTIDGHAVKASTTYSNFGRIIWDHVRNNEATINPVIIGENSSEIILRDAYGYGLPSGTFVQADATSCVNMSGWVAASGSFQNVCQYPSTLNAGTNVNNVLKMYGAPVSSIDTGVQNDYAGNALLLSPLSTTGVTSTTTASDPTYGTVFSVTYAASAGGDGSNRVSFPASPATAPAVNSDFFGSVLVNPASDISISFGGLSDAASKQTVAIKGGVWTRILFLQPNVPSGNQITPVIYETDSLGVAVKITGMEILALPVGTLSSSGILGTVLTKGAFNPNNPITFAKTVRLASDFVSDGTTNFQSIGLGWTVPSTYAIKFSFACDLAYLQNVGNDTVSFGIQAVTANPTNIFATGIQYISGSSPSTSDTATLATLATTTATAIVTGIPAATGTQLSVHLAGTIENPAATANTFNIVTKTATGADTVQVRRGSFCYATP